MKKSHLFSLVFFYLLLVSVSCDVIHDSCDKAAKGDPNIKFDFCVSSFEGNPKAKTATGVADLVKVAIETAMANATSTGAGSSIQSGGKAFEGKDYGTANAEISSAMDAPDTCEEQFKEKKGPPIARERRIISLGNQRHPCILKAIN
ncbi:hypothetical protein V6Z11_A03G008800 [Gossypium hirsutum]